jgi:alkylation response protein AidB-like acyl-CoA dehydrogenase
MDVQRLLTEDEQRDLLAMAAQLSDRELAPRAAGYEEHSRFPREVMQLLGRAGLLSLPYPVEAGGGGQPYEICLQVLEEIARRRASVAVGVSVHSLACYPTFAFGTPEQQADWLPEFLGGDRLGAYCLSEPHAGSDPGAITARADRQPDGSFRLYGTKAWVTHGGEADFYNVFARLYDGGADRGISCFLLRSGTTGLSFARPERKMGLTGSTTASVLLDGAPRRDADQPFSRQASTAKLIATDAAMKVTIDAVQVLGGYGYTRHFPVERYMREAKIMQIFEGTYQIQRMVIGCHLARA